MDVLSIPEIDWGHLTPLWGVLRPLLPGFLLLTARCVGLVMTLPVIGTSITPVPARLALAGLLTMILAPSTGGVSVSLEIVPLLALREVMLGSLLGFGARLMLAALPLAAAAIDQQAGLVVQHTLDPTAEGNTSPTGAWLACLGTLVFFTMEPFNGHLRVVESLLVSFEEVPLGGIETPVRDLLLSLLTHSVWLAVQIVAPIAALLGLMQFAVAVLWRHRGASGVYASLLPARVMLTLALLLLTSPGIGDRIAAAIARVDVFALRAANSSPFPEGQP